MKFLLIPLLISASAFFSASETAVFALRRVDLMRWKKEGNRMAAVIGKMLETPSRLIATMFIGNELVNVSLSSVIAALLIPMIPAYGEIVALAAGTLTILILGDIPPKCIVWPRAKSFSAFSARPLLFFSRIVAPVRFLMEIMAKGILRLLGGGEVAGRRAAFTEREFRALVDVSGESGTLDPGERELIHNIFELTDQRAGGVMTPLAAQACLRRSHLEEAPSPVARVPAPQGASRTRRGRVRGDRRDRDAGGRARGALRGDPGGARPGGEGAGSPAGRLLGRPGEDADPPVQRRLPGRPPRPGMGHGGRPAPPRVRQAPREGGLDRSGALPVHGGESEGDPERRGRRAQHRGRDSLNREPCPPHRALSPDAGAVQRRGDGPRLRRPPHAHGPRAPGGTRGRDRPEAARAPGPRARNHADRTEHLPCPGAGPHHLPSSPALRGRGGVDRRGSDHPPGDPPRGNRAQELRPAAGGPFDRPGRPVHPVLRGDALPARRGHGGFSG